MTELVYLRTDTFVLRELKNNDEEDLSVILNDSEIKRYIPGLALAYKGGFEQLIILSNFNQSLLLVIEDITSKKVIGIIYIYIDNLSSSVHYALASEYRGKGIMPKALKLLVGYLYEQQLVNNITFHISIYNKSSLTIMKKLYIPIFKEYDEEYVFRLQLTEELPF